MRTTWYALKNDKKQYTYKKMRTKQGKNAYQSVTLGTHLQDKHYKTMNYIISGSLNNEFTITAICKSVI